MWYRIGLQLRCLLFVWWLLWMIVHVEAPANLLLITWICCTYMTFKNNCRIMCTICSQQKWILWSKFQHAWTRGRMVIANNTKISYAMTEPPGAEPFKRIAYLPANVAVSYHIVCYIIWYIKFLLQALQVEVINAVLHTHVTSLLCVLICVVTVLIKPLITVHTHVTSLPCVLICVTTILSVSPSKCRHLPFMDRLGAVGVMK